MSKFVKNLLDNDLYKYTTSYAYMKLYPNAECTFKFTDRNNTVYTQEQVNLIQSEINELENLTFDGLDLYSIKNWIKTNISFIPEYYWEWLLHSFRFDSSKVKLIYDKETGHLDIEVTDKPHKATLYEIHVLCIVAGVLGCQFKYDEGEMLRKLHQKMQIAVDNDVFFSEFGTRRRLSYEVQDAVVRELSKCPNCIGTSNVWLAYKYNMRPIGTHPHEWFMFHGAQFGYQNANYLALDAWMQVYNGDLGIALTDTYTTDVFFKNFCMLHAKTYDGLRQDSGSEYKFVDKAIKRYKEHKIDPLTKTIIFSNGLTFEKAAEIVKYCKGKIKAAFGIGTNLTNDVGCKAPNIVMKMIWCRLTPTGDKRECIKLSDDEGKHMGSEREINIALKTLNIID